MRFFDPFQDIDRVFGSTTGLMPMDVFEREGDYILRFDLPGIDPDSIDLTVDDRVLTVSVKRSWEDTEGVNWLVRERPTGSYSRKFRLGHALDQKSIQASYDHGVLSVLVPTKEESKPIKINVATDTTLSLES